jgi:hypothetical protein
MKDSCEYMLNEQTRKGPPEEDFSGDNTAFRLRNSQYITESCIRPLDFAGFMNMVMNLRVPQEEGNYLTSWLLSSQERLYSMELFYNYSQAELINKVNYKV